MKKIINLLLVLCMVLSLSIPVFGVTIEYKDKDGKTVKASDFLDTKGHWAHDTILKCAEYGWIVGNNGNFAPNAYIKRGDLAIILDRMLGLKTTTYNFFNDLPNDSYYRDAVLRCVAAGYINGTSSNTVSPNGYATREQVAVILCRMFNIDTYTSYTTFADDAEIGAWAKPSVAAMKRLGYMNGTGDNRVKPKANITRAELITLLNNIANTYIPKSDKTNQGSSFRGTYPTNIVTSRNIELINSTVGRDIVLTQSASSLNLTNTTVRGRILAMGKASISLSNCEVSKLVLVDGKSSVTGTKYVDEVYIAQYASESTLDAIPDRLILESGVRVKIDGTMYENTTISNKVYYGSDLKADIANEQGYVVGGPKVSGVKFYQDQDNTITVDGIKITVGDSSIKEIGVIWLDQDDDEDTINPTYQNCDGKKIYNLDKIGEPFGFTVGSISGTRAYRVYVKDKDGLFAYSNTTVFTAYSFSTSLKIYDNDYPEKLDVELVFRGNNIPDISSIRVVYDVDELYSEKHNEVSLRLYSDPDAEVQPDTTKYKRYTATITSPTTRVEGQTVVTPPTAFGYIITFKNGTIINRFPILTNAVPDGVSPMAELKTGTATYNGGNNFTVKGSRVTTRYAIPQEVGIVYKTSDSLSVSRPVADASGWVRKSSSVSLGLNESASFDSVIPLNSRTGYTHYAAYVKTSNGYWYGNVHTMANDVQGDEGGYLLTNGKAVVLNDSKVVVSCVANGAASVSVDNITFSSEYLNCVDKYVAPGSKSDEKILYMVLDTTTPLSSTTITWQMTNAEGKRSNKLSIPVDFTHPISITLSGKARDSYSYYYYIVNFPSSNYEIRAGGSVVNNASLEGYSQYYNNVSYIYVRGDADYSTVKFSIPCSYYVNGHEIRFNREISLY